MKVMHLSLLLGVSLLTLCSTRTALADAAPPMPPPGTSLEPGESITNVRMLWEDVLMTVTDNSATVRAVFRFQNQSTETEAFFVRFPLGMSVQGPINDFSASVDGTPTQITTVEQPSAQYESPIPWATWPMTFPPGVTVETTVTYTVAAYRYNGLSALQRYSYILATGAGWYGSIGEGTITVRLPYQVNENTVCIGAKCSWKPSPGWYTTSGTDMVWHFTDLEPIEADNIGIIVLDPSLYRSLQEARSQIQVNPNSPDAQLNLARLISPAVNAWCGGIWDYGCAYAEGPTTDLISEALTAYRRALELAPNDANLYAEYLEFLISTTGYIEEIDDELFPKLEYAFTLDPSNERLLKICAGLEELGLWPPAASVRPLSPTETQALGAANTPMYNQTSTPTKVPAAMQALATKPVLSANTSSVPRNQIAAWLTILAILGLLFMGMASAIIIVVRKIH